MYYQKHVFVCTNQKDGGKKCCHQAGATEAVKYLKERVAELGKGGPGGVRVSSSGCMGRCSEGPVIAIYPQGEWFTYHTEQELEAILQVAVLEQDQELPQELKL